MVRLMAGTVREECHAEACVPVVLRHVAEKAQYCHQGAVIGATASRWRRTTCAAEHCAELHRQQKPQAALPTASALAVRVCRLRCGCRRCCAC